MPKASKSRWAGIVGLVSACVLSVAVCHATTITPMPTTAAEQDPDAVRVLLSPQLEAVLSSPMVGQIQSLNAHLGHEVHAGDLLLAFECSETQAQLHMAQVEKEIAAQNLETRRHLRKLAAVGAAEIRLAELELEKMQAALDMTQARMQHCEVRAPFDGHVVKVSVKPHQSVSVGAPLIELVSEGSLKLRMNVPSRLLKKLSVGTPLEVFIMETDRTWPATVSALNARVDAVAQTIEIEAALTDPEQELLPGMSGIARFAW